MSYILDALRRADAERQRGTVPGLHDLPLDSTLNDAPAPPATRSRRLGLAALALGVLGLAVGAGWWLRPVGQAAGRAVAVSTADDGPGRSDVSAAGRAPLALPDGAAAPAQPPAADVMPPPMPALPPTAVPKLAQAASTAGVRIPGAAEARPAPTPAPTLRALPVPTAAPSANRPVNRQPAPASSALPPPVAGPAEPAAGATPRPAAVPAASAPAAARTPLFAELPEAQKRELGPLVVGGAMHGDQAALRIVILNGQVVHEGDKLGADLQVLQIRLKSVVFSHRGQRFELPF